MRKGKLFLFTVVALVFVSGCATTPSRIQVDHAALSEAAIQERTRFIEERLDAHKRHAQIWYWSWMAVNSGAAVGLSIAAGVTDETPDRVDFTSQAVLAALGVADLLLRPLEARYGADPIRRMPEATRTQQVAKLRAAEDLLYRNAERAAQRHDWVFHFLNVVLNAGAGIATGIAGDKTQGAISAGAGVAGGEIYILAQPAGPEKDWEEYQTLFLDRSNKKLSFSLQPQHMGLMMTLRW
jgi:hypothetical protein